MLGQHSGESLQKAQQRRAEAKVTLNLGLWGASEGCDSPWSKSDQSCDWSIITHGLHHTQSHLSSMKYGWHHPPAHTSPLCKPHTIRWGF